MNNVPGGLTIQRTLHSGATATADGTALPCEDGRTGAKTVAIFQITGITTATITFKGTVDGTNYVAIPVTNLNSGTAATTATADGIYRVTCIGLLNMLADITAYTSGTIIVTGKAVA